MITSHFVFPKKLKNEAYRKSIHLLALWIPVFIYFSSSTISFCLFSFLLICDLMIEYGNYKKIGIVRKTYGRIFYRAMRVKEQKKDKFELVGSIYIFLSAMICVLLFSKEVAVVSMSVMLIADAMAAMFGKAYGKTLLIKGKSLEGTLAFFTSSILVMLILELIYPITYASIIACVFATMVEVFSKKLHTDDNLLIPIITGLILTYL